jgi:DNA-directed RNA polymerase specialized sigma24 family protein
MTREEQRLQAEAIALMKMNGWTALDIAKKLRISPATVVSALKRGAK